MPVPNTLVHVEVISICVLEFESMSFLLFGAEIFWCSCPCASYFWVFKSMLIETSRTGSNKMWFALYKFRLVLMGIPNIAAVPADITLSSLGEACVRMDLIAIHEIVENFGYEDDEGASTAVSNTTLSTYIERCTNQMQETHNSKKGDGALRH